MLWLCVRNITSLTYCRFYSTSKLRRFSFELYYGSDILFQHICNQRCLQEFDVGENGRASVALLQIVYRVAQKVSPSVVSQIVVTKCANKASCGWICVSHKHTIL